MADRITPHDIATWRRALEEEGDGEFLDPTTAQVIAAKLMAEIELLWDERATVEADVLALAAVIGSAR